MIIGSFFKPTFPRYWYADRDKDSDKYPPHTKPVLPGSERCHLGYPHGPYGQLPALQLELLSEDQLHRLWPLARVIQHGAQVVKSPGHEMELDLQIIRKSCCVLILGTFQKLSHFNYEYFNVSYYNIDNIDIRDETMPPHINTGKCTTSDRFS